MVTRENHGAGPNEFQLVAIAGFRPCLPSMVSGPSTWQPMQFASAAQGAAGVNKFERLTDAKAFNRPPMRPIWTVVIPEEKNPTLTFGLHSV